MLFFYFKIYIIIFRRGVSLLKTNKSKKSLIYLIAIVLICVVAAFIFSKSKSREGAGTSKNGGVFSSIEDAITKSLSLKCEYKVGENTTIAYVKGKNIRIEGTWEGKSNSSAIMKDNKLWSWDSQKKEGIIFPFDMTEGQEKGTTSQSIIEGLENQKQFCKVSVFSDSMFDPPTDVKFQDLGNLENLNIPLEE